MNKISRIFSEGIIRLNLFKYIFQLNELGIKSKEAMVYCFRLVPGLIDFKIDGRWAILWLVKKVGKKNVKGYGHR
ncbi:MAG: hypothetical protein GY710_25940 [Desulfobacteraceae bacterium]|nr:hypothetical protein [Desulfobacteraceae bacterium]